jgi:hypothetical protein
LKFLFNTAGLDKIVPEHLFALNTERIAEEHNGLIHWMCPESTQVAIRELLHINIGK